MPKQKVFDTEIQYEAYGCGETVVYLQSVLGGINPGAYYFAGRLSGKCRVIIWDGPNCGQSGAAFRQTKSEYHLACEYLAGLLDVLGEQGVHIAGCSGGGEMGLLFAHLYPGRAKSLAMYRPVDTSCEVEQEVIRARYLDIAEAAERSVEEAVARSKNPPPGRFGNLSRWVGELYDREEDVFRALDGKALADILRSWGNWMGSPYFYRAGLSEEELAAIGIPVRICSCPDDYHPERLVMDLCRNLPAATGVSVGGYRMRREIYNADYDENPFGGFPEFVNEYETFVKKLLK